MKKKFTLFIMMLAALLGSSSAWAQTFIQGDMKYTVLDADAKTVSVAKANNDIAGDIVIPSTVTNGNVAYTVTTISEYAFENLPITSVSIPGTVTSLADRAFGDCHSLGKITFEESTQPLTLVYGYYGSFQYCDADKQVIVKRNLTPSEGCPFYDNVTSAVIGGKATTVANSLFYGQRKMTSISIGNSVTSIGNGAFAGCGDGNGEVEMTLTLSENITTIGEKAFFNCPALKSLALPSTLKLIGGEAFSYANIASLVIPESVDSIGEHAFENCKKLTSIRIEDSDKPLRMREGYNRPFHYCDAPKTVYLGRNLIQSEDGTPFETAVTSVEIGDKVTTINPSMFWGNSKLTSVTIGNGVKTIGSAAFRGAGNDEYTVGELSVTMGENVETICSEAFNSCPKLLSISLPSTLKLIEGYAFSGTGLGSITIPASVDSIGKRAFGSCDNLASIRFEDSDKPLKLINGYDGTFNYSQADKSVYVGRDLTFQANGSLISVGSANITSVQFGDQVTNINPQLFYDANKLNSLTIGKGVKTIGSEAFRGAGDDENVGELSVTMGENVETIGSYAFDICPKLYSITLPATLKTIEGYAFSGSGLGSISIPASVDSLGYRAFGSCGNLASISIEDSTEPLKLWRGYDGTFNYSNADKSMYIGRDLKLDADDRLFYNDTGNVTALQFGDLVTTINPYLFKESDKLSSLVIGNGVKTIGIQAFYGSGDDENIGELSVTMGENVETIGVSAFDYCVKMTSINLPATLKTIGEWAFSMCSSLGSISIPGSVTSIGKGAFGNTPLTDITFEDGDEPCSIVLGYDATFRNPQADYTLYLGRNLVYEGNSCPFPNATAVTIGSKVTSLAPNMLNNQKLLSVKVPWPTPIAIQENVFSGSTYSNATLWLPGGTKQAYAEAEGWKNFVNVEFASYVVSLEATKGGSLTTGDITVAGEQKAQTLIDRGNDVTFTVKPEQNYDFTSLTVNGEAVEMEENAYTYYALYQDIDVKAIFTEKPKFDIQATATGGTVSLNGGDFLAEQTIKVYRDTDVTLSVAPAEGYQQKPAKVTVNGVDVTAQLQDNTLKIENIQEAKAIIVTFAKLQFAITTEQTQNGSIELSKQTVEWGDSFTATFKPATGYELATATVNGKDVTAEVKDGVLTVADVKEAKSVGATFKKLTFQIAAEQTQNGSIELSASTVEWGDSFTATFKPATGYELLTATVNGEDVTADVENNVLTVSDVRVNVTVGATFQKQTYAVTISGGGITVSNQNPKYGDDVTVTIDDDPDRTLVSLLVNGTDVTAQVKNGQYIIKNVTGNVTIEATFKSTKEFITMTGEYATFSCPQDLNFTGSNLRAYIASGFNKATGQALLTRVYDVPAGTGIFLVGQPGTTYKIAYSETSSYYVNLFKANLAKSTIQATEGDKVNFTYDVQDGEPGFYPIDGTATLLAQTAYMQLPAGFVQAGVKVSVIFEEDIIDGIEEFRISESDATIYDLAGRRLGKTQRGIYIVNGKKVLMK